MPPSIFKQEGKTCLMLEAFPAELPCVGLVNVGSFLLSFASDWETIALYPQYGSLSP